MTDPYGRGESPPGGPAWGERPPSEPSGAERPSGVSRGDPDPGWYSPDAGPTPSEGTQGQGAGVRSGGPPPMPPAGAGADPGWGARAGHDEPPVTDVAPPPRRGGRGRWIVAALATVLVVGGVIAGVLLLNRTTGAAVPASASYLPANTFMFSEIRLDLPGDQRERLGEFLGHFPGFDDRANLDRKVAESLDRLLGQATQQRYSYSGDIQPWFGGQVGIAVLEAPVAPTGATMEVPRIPALLATLSVSDAARARALVDRATADLTTAGASISSGTHNGTPTWTITPGASDDSGAALTYALTQDTLVIGIRSDDVTAALDRKGASENLASQAEFRDRVDDLRSDRLGFIYFNGAAYRDAALQQLQQTQSAFPLPACFTDPIRNAPTSVLAEVHAEGDRIVADARVTLPEGAPVPAVRDSGLQSRVPAGTLAYIELRDVGAGIADCIRDLKATAARDESTQRQVEQAEQALGSSLESFFEWIGDAAISVRMEGEVPAGGIVATVTDTAAAAQRIERLKALAQLAGGFGGAQIEVRDQERNGVVVTTISVPRDAAPGIPPGLSKVTFALHGDVFAFGTGDFAATVVSQDADVALGADARFSEAVESAGGPSSSSLLYIDVRGIREAIEGALEDLGSVGDSEQAEFYQREVRPYVLPFDRIVQVTGGGGGEQTSTFELIVSEPEGTE